MMHEQLRNQAQEHPSSSPNEAGFSLIEAMMASSVFALIITALAGALVFGAQASVTAGARARATELAIEGIESVRNIRDEAFNELQYAQSGVDDTGGSWDFLGEGSTETIGEFTRTISFADVCRDSTDLVAACPASYTDPHTKQVTAVVEWESRPSFTSQVERTTYLTNWETAVWPQADWSGGSGQAEWSNTTRYESDDGNVDTATAGELKLASSAPVNWWDTNYLYRQKITFGTAHSALPQHFTASLIMDTRPSTTNVELSSGDDVRIVWQPTVGSPVELDRLADTWNSASSTIDFRLQSEIGANLNEDVDGAYYAYYGNAAAGTPPTDEGDVYYFADFFNRADSSTIGNGWTEWTTGGGNVSISSNAATVSGNNTGPPDAGIKQAFGLGAISGDFVIEYDWTLPTNPEGIWTHYVNIGNAATMADSSRTTGVGPGIYAGEGAHFSPNGTVNISNDLSGNMENNPGVGPHSIRLEVDAANSDYDYYRNGGLVASNQNWVNPGETLDQIRIATDQYINSATPFTYDNLKVFLAVSDDPEEAGGSEESQGIGQIVDDTEPEFNAGSHSATQYDAGNSWLELTGAGQTAGTGTFTSDIFDAGSTASWADLTWVPQRPTGKELPNNGGQDWWDTNYTNRRKVTFGTDHTALPLHFTAAFSMDTRPSATNVELTSGNDVRIVWQPVTGSPVELDRLGDTWNNAATTIRFRLQSAIGANLDEDVDGSYYVYYGHSGAGVPPTDEGDVYYFADFFNRADSSTIGNGWTEWTDGGGNVSIASNAVAVVGNNAGPADAGIKQTFGLGAVPGDFVVEFAWTLPTNSEAIWTHYLNVGNSMADSSRTTGVGPGIYSGEGAHFSPDGTVNISNDLSGNMENNPGVGPHSIRMEVDTTADDYDYYRDDILIASGQNFVNSIGTINQIRIATDQYAAGQPAFTYDDVRVSLSVSNDAEEVPGSEESQTAVAETGYAEGNVSMAGNQFLLHLNETAGATTFTDDSGLGRNPTCSGGACPTAGGAGKLNQALDFDGSNDIITAPTTLNQWLGATASVSFWIKTTQVGNATFWQAPGVVGVEQAGGGNDIFWGWLDDTGRIGFKVGDGAGLQSTSPVNDDEWHHVLMTRNHTTGAIALYVDGVSQTTTSDTGTKTTSFSEIGRIGDTGGTPAYFDGLLDEFSIWNRVLSSTEATDVYRRSALNMRFQLRSCDDAACSGESFVGPDGTTSTYYDELANTTLNPPAATTITNIGDNRYFQYQVLMTTDNPAISPELVSVTIDYTALGGGGFETAGSLQSSAFDMGNASPVQVIEWDETIPSCSPACTIQFQVRTAPDASGSPGTWTNWYGAGGDGTYFTAASGTRIPVDLNGNQWVQYRVELAGDGLDTPILEEVRVSYR